MFDGLAYLLLLGYLGRYFKDIQKEQLNIRLADGLVNSSGGNGGVAHIRTDPCMARSVSVHGCSQMQGQSSIPAQGEAIANHSNGNVHRRDVNLLKRRWSRSSDNEEKSGLHGTHIMEERYQSMLGDHIKKYKRRLKDTSTSPGPNQVAVPFVNSNTGLKAHKLGNEHRGGLHAAETTSEWMNESNAQKPGKYRDADFMQQTGTDRSNWFEYN